MAVDFPGRVHFGVVRPWAVAFPHLIVEVPSTAGSITAASTVAVTLIISPPFGAGAAGVGARRFGGIPMGATRTTDIIHRMLGTPILIMDTLISMEDTLTLILIDSGNHITSQISPRFY